MHRVPRWAFGVFLVVAGVLPAGAQAPTVGLFAHEEGAYRGYTLFGPNNSETVYLINDDGLVVHTWVTASDNRMAYLRDNGNLVRAARVGGRVEEYDWDGNLLWEFDPTGSGLSPHHDIEPLPNGNVLVIAWETKSQAEAIAAGRNPAHITQGQVTPDVIAEVHPLPPNGWEIVWEWHVWDHLIQDFDPTKANFGVVADHPELIDVNYGPWGADWNHANGVAYNPDFDQIVVSSRTFSEFWVIDHSTTTGEAAGHTGGSSGKGGDVLYRWGNPAVYRRGTTADQQLYGQHDAQWIPPGRPGEGNFIVFNNGFGRPEGAYSSIEEIVPPVDENGTYSIGPTAPFGPESAVWTYTSTPPEDFYSSAISGVQRQPNGTTLICEGLRGHLFEVTQAKATVWDYVNPVGSGGPVHQGDPPPATNGVFKIRRYPPDGPAFAGRNLVPGDPVELFDEPRPVPDASVAVAKLSDAGEEIRVDWDASSCPSFDYHLLYGDLSEVATLALAGAECNLGLSGSYDWTDAPPMSAYFLLVGTDDTGVYESTWGEDSSGAARNGTTASFLCGTTTKIVSATCP